MTYLLLNALVLAIVVAVSWPANKSLRRRPQLRAAVLLTVLTVVFDSLIIYFGVVAYTPGKWLGITLWRAPIEDFAYALAAVVLVPALWHYFSPKKERS